MSESLTDLVAALGGHAPPLAQPAFAQPGPWWWIEAQRLGALLKTVRLAQGLSQQDVALKTAASPYFPISKSTVSRVENGRTQNLDAILRVADALGYEMSFRARSNSPVFKPRHTNAPHP